MDDDIPDIIKQCTKKSYLQLEKESTHSSSLLSLELLKKYGSRMKRLTSEEHIDLSCNAPCDSTGCQELSTIDIMEIARTKYMNDVSLSSGDLSILINPVTGGHSGLSFESSEDVKLALVLLASADKVANQQFDRARKLLSMCSHLSSSTGNPVERVVYYFAEALRDRIDRKTGKVSSGWEGNKRWLSRVEEETSHLQPSAFAYFKELPLVSVTQSAGIQAILDSMASVKNIHLVDLGIRSGSQWTILMQALSVRHECPIEILKITAVGTTSKELIEATGRRLSCFAKSMSLPFSFKIVMVSDMKDLTEDMFELEAGEAVGIYSGLFLRILLACPSHLETTFRVIRNLCPTVMVVTEVEANTDSPVFMDRFVEALFFYSANFDSLEACMDRSNQNRMILEADYFGGGIKNVITFDEDERTTVNMKIDGWRAYFKRFGIVERELSMSSLYQAKLVIQNSAYGSSCTLDLDGKCLLVGWKGTPIFSLSAWRFLQEEEE